MNSTKKNKKGFSLIELIIYMGLLSVLLLILTQVFTSIISAKLDSESTSSIDQDANFLLTRFAYDISRATALTTPSNFVVCTVNCTLVVTINGNTYTYAVNGGNLQITNNFGTDNLNAYNTTISNFKIARIGNGTTPVKTDTIKINFTITSKVTRASGNEARDYEITVAPR